MSVSKQLMKRKLEDEKRVFQEQWTEKFCFIEHKGNIICIICKATIAVPKDYNLKRHFQSKHSDFDEKYSGTLRTQKITSMVQLLQAQQDIFKKCNESAEQAVEVSFDIANLIAKSSRPFTDGDFVKNCLIVASKKLCCTKCTSKFEALSLNRMTIQRRITDISADIVTKFSTIFKNCIKFSLAVDESTDVTSIAQLCIYARCITSDYEIFEELLELYPMKDQTRGSDLLQALLSSIQKHNLDLSKLSGIVTDGAPSMIGSKIGMTTLLSEHMKQKGIHTDLMKYHCIIHQQNLIGKNLGFDHVMKKVVKAVNFIRSRGLNHRQFKEFLNEIECEYGDVLYYSEVRWLSRGKVLQRFLILIEEIKMFLKEKNQPVDYLEDSKWICDLAFLTDICGHLNDLNLKLQGKSQLITTLHGDVSAFRIKLSLFHSQITNNNTCHFSNCDEIFKKYNMNSNQYGIYIQQLQQSFNVRFEDLDRYKILFSTFANPFEASHENAESKFQLELIDIQCNEELKSKFNEGDLMNFYRCLPTENFPNLLQNAALCGSLFGSTYICEQTFSIMKLNKSNQRNRLTNENLNAVVRVATTNITPDVKKLASNMQPQKSH
jgi:putative ubiquitin-RnfH superfamily antitoxin RatB of RatAB toxin-antitoxin module